MYRRGDSGIYIYSECLVNVSSCMSNGEFLTSFLFPLDTSDVEQNSSSGQDKEGKRTPSDGLSVRDMQTDMT